MSAKKAKADKLVSKDSFASQIRDLIPKAELAEMLNVTVNTLTRWNKIGVAGVKLPKVKIGGQVYYRPADVDRFRRIVQ